MRMTTPDHGRKGRLIFSKINISKLIIRSLIFSSLTFITPAIIPTSANAAPNPVCSGATCTVTFTYTGASVAYTPPQNGTYTLTVWGASGGNGIPYSSAGNYSLGGLGGYATGQISLTTSSVVYVYVGGVGTTLANGTSITSATLAPGGFNGGGSGTTYGMSGGGGGTDIRVGGSALSNRVIVAGGGGGGGNSGGASTNSNGGAGGGTSGITPNSVNQFSGRIAGSGGTQTTGNALGVGQSSNNNLQGGGGGGYWGGYVGANSTGGGGGSAYVGGVTSGSMIDGATTMPNPSGGTMTGNSGNGVAVITYPNGPVLSGNTNMTGFINTSFSQTITFTDAVGTLVGTIGMSPATSGVTFNGSTGLLTVLIATPTSFNETFTATDNNGKVATLVVTITVNLLVQSTLNISAGSTSSAGSGSTYFATPNFSTSGGSGTGAVTYAIVAGGTATSCALSNNSASSTLTATTAGTCLIAATKASDSSYQSATSSNLTFTFTTLTAQATLSISASVTSATYTGSAYTNAMSLSTTGGSGTGAVTYAIASGGTATSCTLSSSASNATLTATTNGTCLIKATKAQDATYAPAQSSNLTFTFNKANQATLTISGVTNSATYSGTSYSATPSLSSSGGSGTGAVTYAIVAGGTATSCALSSSASDATLTATTVGTCLIQGTKAADVGYNVVTSANFTFTFGTALQATLTISETVTSAAWNGSAFTAVPTLSSSGGSGTGAVTYAIYSGGSASGCSLSANTSSATLTATSIGTCLIQGTKAASANYSLALSTNTLTFTFNLASQSALSIQETTTTTAYNGSAYTATPSFGTTGGSGTGAVTYSIYAGGSATNCRLSSSAANATLTADSTGTCFIMASKAADTHYTLANSSYITFTFTRPLALTTPTNGLVGTEGSAFTLNLAPLVVGGVTPYTFTQSGTLPTGVTFSGSTISGTPGNGTKGSYPGLTFSVRDAANTSLTSSAFTITITPCGVSATLTNTLLAPNGYCLIQFSTAGSGTWTPPAGVANAQVVVIGGGGGSGKSNTATSAPGGAGGGGGVVINNNVDVSSGSAINISVGAGGAAATSAANDASTRNGSSSTFGSTITALGGGGGGSNSYAGAGGSSVATGGGGGGNPSASCSGSTPTGTAYAGGTVTSGLNGSYGVWGWGGSGGGAYAAATNGVCPSPNYGQPGAGISSSITGTAVEYGRGGYAYKANLVDTVQFGWGGTTAYTGGINGIGSAGQTGAVFAKYISPAVVTTNTSSQGDSMTVTSGTTITLIETATISSFTRTVIWQYSTDSGSTWLTENTSAVSGGNALSSYSFVVRCGMHTSNSCATPSVQIWYRAKITDTDSTLYTYSYSPVITVNISSIATTKLILNSAPNNGKYALTLSGGGGSGSKSITIIAGGSATNCNLVGNNLDADSSGTCFVQGTQIADNDYLASYSLVLTLFFTKGLTLDLVPVNAWVAPIGSTGIGGMVQNPGLQNNNSATQSSLLAISGISVTSGPAGTTITISGTGFLDGNNNPLISAIAYNDGLDPCDFSVTSSTQITVTVPSSSLPNGTTGGDQFAVQPSSGATLFTPTFTVT